MGYVLHTDRSSFLELQDLLNGVVSMKGEGKHDLCEMNKMLQNQDLALDDWKSRAQGLRGKWEREHAHELHIRCGNEVLICTSSFIQALDDDGHQTSPETR